MSGTALIIANFGGPRSLTEIPSFLEELLTDPDVIRTSLPSSLHHFLFKRIAKKRALKIADDYKLIGGKSPIFEDTEWIAAMLGKKLSCPVLAFHRYLTDTHAAFLERIRSLEAHSILVFPMFPQFTYATTGSIAKWFATHLCSKIVKKMDWIKSYPSHRSFVTVFQNTIRDFLKEKGIVEEEALLLFSAHGMPKKFICEGDIYQKECERSFQNISQGFQTKSLLAYQSQFGKAEWIGPSTLSLCERPHSWIGRRKQVVIVPLSFTSDHIETLFEIEQQYVPLLHKAGIQAYRCPALNRRDDWLEAICSILKDSHFASNQMLIRPKTKACCHSCRGFCCRC
jgi:protoporphyrin/coproporphyrin ferrochelatase